MPIINISTADVKRAQVVDKKWYPLQVSITGPTPNAAKDGVNFVASFTIIDSGDLDGKEILRYYSSKAIGMIIPLVAAVRGVPVESIKEGFQLDTDELQGKKIDGLVDTDVYEGRLRNICEVYLPYKTSSNQQPF